MSHLQIHQLQVGYGHKTVLQDINLHVAKGEMIALLGPSGCGKTTLLNTLCGFIPSATGYIQVADKDITTLAAEKRNITMVFQSYALWPHMSVAQNIGYGLKIRKMKRVAIQQRVQELLQIVNLQGLANENVANLSGGQRQRVALARALAIHPDVLVLDEPLSNLDAKVRLSVRHEIKNLQKKLGFTSLIVTHDQEEALVMADRIAVLNQGRIEQIGTPEEIYQHPATPFVADFMGADNCINWSSNTPQSMHMQLNLPLKRITNSQMYFRSEAVQVHQQEHENTGLLISGIVEQSAFLGGNYRLSVRCGDQLIQADHPHPLSEQADVTLRVPPHALHVFEQLASQSHLSLQSNF